MPDQDTEIEDRYLDDGRLGYRVCGSDSGPTALFLHGWPQDGEMWLPVVNRLSPHIRAVIPDLRGFGRSQTAERLNAPDFVADQVRLLDHLGAGPVHLVGHDWGGWTAFLMAIEHPARVSTLTVVNAPHPWPRLGLSTLGQLPKSWYALLLATPGIGPAVLRNPSFVRTMLRRGSAGSIDTVEATRLAESFADHDRAAGISSLYRYYWHAFSAAALDSWKDDRLEMPTLLLFGREDRMISSDLVAEGLAEHSSRGRVELVDGAGHFLPDQRPDLVAERVLGQIQLSS